MEEDDGGRARGTPGVDVNTSFCKFNFPSSIVVLCSQWAWLITFNLRTRTE
jgi:hypothetical protein